MSSPKPETQLLREAYGDTVRAWREGRGWNRTQFANALGMSRQNLLHIEAGRNDPTYATLLRLARALNTQAWNLGRCIELRLARERDAEAQPLGALECNPRSE